MLSVSVSLNLTPLDRMAAMLDLAASGAADADITAAMATTGKELLLDTWTAQASPEGKPWAARTKPYPWQPLDKTGEMKLSADVQPGPSALSLVFAVADPKSLWHQYGTRRMPARPMLWTGDVPPATWVSALEAAGQARMNNWISTWIGAVA